MPSYCKVIIMGNLTRDPELRYTPGGAAVCEFAVAVNRKWSDKQGQPKEEVGFFDCTAWAKTAEVIAEHLKKGNPIFVEGRLMQDRWQDKESGQNRSKIKITVERFQFIGSKAGNGDSSAPPPQEEGAPEYDNTPF